MRRGDWIVLGALALAVGLGAGVVISRLSAPAGIQGSRPNVKGISRAEAEKAGLSMKEAAWYTKQENGVVRCELCPRLCILGPGARGYCKVRVNIDGTLYSLVYGRIAAIHVDPIEKKPLFHFLPGAKALSIATAGCDLSCAFCQNWTISQAYPEETQAETLTPRDIVDMAKREGCQVIAYTYNEPTVFYEFMLDCAKLARQNGIRNVWVTAAYITPGPLRELAKYLDAANVDIKGIRDDYYRKYCDGHVEPVLDAIKILKEEGVYVEITNLVVPDGNDSDQDIRDLSAWVMQNLGPDAVLHFSRYFPMYKMEQPGPTPESTLLQARRIAQEQGLRYVYIGNLPGPGYEDTICPNCGRLLVRRIGFDIDWSTYGIVNGACRYCGAKVSGVWK
ncbi:MAG: AmmeMemoRadiSam system radical SAM enzyme [Spirochaetia bacterium]|jgi:pyruvate formate lyase activating enzyme